MTEAELVNLLAHEFFHNYRESNYEDDSRDSFVKVFNLFQNKGIADLIDKEESKEKETYAAFKEKWMEMYEQAYGNTPATLSKIDSLVKVYETNPSKEDLTPGGEYIPLADLVVFNGHPVGLYMTRLIREEGLFHPLIRNFDNPIKFIQLYNRAARKHNRTSSSQEYVLSQKLIKHVKKQQCKY